MNEITEISTNTTIPSYVYYIDLSNNYLQYIDSGVFRQLPRLHYLDISYNKDLHFDVLSNISYDLQFTAIKVLNLSAIHCKSGKGTTMTYKDLHFLSNTSLEEFNLANNRIEWVEQHVIRDLSKTIRKIDLSNNRFVVGYYITEIGFLENLRELNLSYTSSTYGLPAITDLFCWAKKDIAGLSYQLSSPREYQRKQLFKKHFGKRSINFTFHFPRQLEVIDFRSSFTHFDEESMKHVRYDIPNLKVYIAKSNFAEKLLGRNGFPLVEYMDFSNNYCTSISANYFENNTHLKQLKLNDNSLAYFLANSASSTLFRDLHRLEFLDLSRNAILKLPDALLSPLAEINHLKLTSNNMEGISFSLGHMQKLRRLDLSNNRIRFLSQKTMKETEQICRSHRVTIDLSQNLLLCSCDTLSFLKWISEHRRLSDQCVHFLNFKSYKCSYTNLTQLSLEHIDEIIDDLRLKCSSKIGIIVGVVLFLVVIIGITISSILYRYRWKLRYWYYTTKRVFQVPNAVYKEAYRYKAFLSYADEDGEFVLNEIFRSLEKDGKAEEICLHARDFTPSRSIADNIAAAIHTSRFTVCIISKYYLDSYWCKYEFNLAKMETEYARGGENAVLLVVMNDFRLDNLPLTLLAHMKDESYLEVPPIGDVEAKHQFLERMKNSIS